MTREQLFTNNCRVENKQSVVEKVFDGDTILIKKGDGVKIRLLGIDAFEHEQNIYGMKGKNFLTMLLLNKPVCVETDVQKNDIYGRTLGSVFAKTDSLSGKDARNRATTSQNIFINEELLRSGYAILYDFPPNTKYLYRLKEAQIYGRENMLGIWEKQSFILETPAQWRHKHPYKNHKKN